jgi:ACT domain-containing protein
MPTALQADLMGPVDVAVILFEGNQFNGDVAPAIAELADSGTVRVIDLAFVRKETDESISIVEVSEADVTDTFKDINESQFDLLSDEDLSDIAQGLDPGSAALVVVWENSWAARMAAAVRASRGRVIDFERIPADRVVRAIAALNEE